jgi:hypothetical protein
MWTKAKRINQPAALLRIGQIKFPYRSLYVEVTLAAERSYQPVKEITF